MMASLHRDLLLLVVSFVAGADVSALHDLNSCCKVWNHVIGNHLSRSLRTLVIGSATDLNRSRHLLGIRTLRLVRVSPPPREDQVDLSVPAISTTTKSPTPPLMSYKCIGAFPRTTSPNEPHCSSDARESGPDSHSSSLTRRSLDNFDHVPLGLESIDASMNQEDWRGHSEWGETWRVLYSCHMLLKKLIVVNVNSLRHIGPLLNVELIELAKCCPNLCSVLVASLWPNTNQLHFTRALTQLCNVAASRLVHFGIREYDVDLDHSSSSSSSSSTENMMLTIHSIVMDILETAFHFNRKSHPSLILSDVCRQCCLRRPEALDIIKRSRPQA